jgi:5-methyltetrahydrofolate--homocysteine methyltransferase
MAIDFDQTRWQQIRQDYQAWWDGTLDRPLVQVTVSGRPPGRSEPEVPGRGYMAHYGQQVSPEAIIDRCDYDLSCRYFTGDAFPHVWLNFGAGVAAAFLGADMSCDQRTVWFHPQSIEPIEEIELRYDPDNPVLDRVRRCARAASDRWAGCVQVGTTDLGGATDILSTFRPSERLLLDLYDAPEHVKQRVDEIHALWFRYFDELNGILQPANPGYTCWTPIFSETPYYMLQSDFCYMIGPEMFDEFVKPELVAACQRLDHPFYHLDGPGQLPHLDSLLEIRALCGIQWVFGAGNEPARKWLDVYDKIHAAGKRIQLLGDADDLDAVADRLGTAKGIFAMMSATPETVDKLARRLEPYGVPVGI